MSVDIKTIAVDELAEALITTLSNQEQSMAALKTHIEEQLIALRSQDRSALENLTAETSGIVSSIHQLQTQRDDNLQQLATSMGIELDSISIEPVIKKLEEYPCDEEHLKTIKELSQRIPLEAHSIRESSKELAYSLQYALHLGHQMIEAIQGAVSYPPILIYTAEGSKKLSASKRMMVNKIG